MIVVEMSGSVCVCGDDDGSDGDESGSVDDCGGDSVDSDDDGSDNLPQPLTTLPHIPAPISPSSSLPSF